VKRAAGAFSVCIDSLRHCRLDLAIVFFGKSWTRGSSPGSSPIRANLSLDPQPLGCHAPLYAGHPVIPAREVEATPCQIGRSLITGSSAYADDDDREDGNRLKLARMGVKPAGDGEWSEFNLIGICSNRRQGWQVAILFLTTLVLDAWLGVLSIEGSV